MTNAGPKIVATTTGTGSSSGVRTLDVSGLGLQEGDLLLVVFGFSANSETFAMTGFTEVCALSAGSTRDCHLHIGYKVQTSTPDTSVTLNSASMSTSQAWAAIAYNIRDFDASNVLDVSATTATASNTGLADPPTISPASPRSLVIASASIGAINAEAISSPDLKSFTALQRDPISGSESVMLGSGFLRSSGSPNPLAFTKDSDTTQDGYCACTLALRPV